MLASERAQMSHATTISPNLLSRCFTVHIFIIVLPSAISPRKYLALASDELLLLALGYI